ncbi:hypothetical protein LX81_02614 [Palleronia aestuarii]|uniref:Porin domain-containing protein n=1 Tax=Palleronia aestuarii TaxID=568105 RepID=A0A2W7NP52_9RHOB|nr:porin [Palleronia aestuarii]PZX15026.1 hypothetical protein LX81_02614 [Palleronia aestuarii]
MAHSIKIILAVTAIATASPALAQPKVFGEAGLSFTHTDLGDAGDLDARTIHASGAFVSAAGLGIQIGGSYLDLGIGDGADLETFTGDLHIYGDFGTSKVGAFASVSNLDEIEIDGFGALDLDTKISTYGLEGQSRIGATTLSAYAGIGEIEDVSDVDTVIYGLGASYDLTSNVALAARYDVLDSSVDGFDDADTRFAALSLGIDYYVDLPNAPLRLSTSVAHAQIEDGDFDEGDVRFGINIAVLFGGDTSTRRERLFDTLIGAF